MTLAVQQSADLTEREFQRVSRLVYDHCGINLHEGKRELVRARLSTRLRAGGYRSVGDYIDHVLADPTGSEFTTLIDTVSTNLTSFFRESRHFDYLAAKFLPPLLDGRRRDGQRRLRAWSAGCSSGEEPYTLAMVVLESLPDPANWDVKILATDISTKVLKLAETGRYGDERVRSVPPGLRPKYFAQDRKPSAGSPPTYRVVEHARRLVCFRHLNLMAPWPFTGPFDFIFCRNVMIYFDKPTQEKLVGRYHDCLAKGGLLFTGHSESLTGISHKFRYVEPTIYQK
jgi:chemotaxis protein methyltransferase CheR